MHVKGIKFSFTSLRQLQVEDVNDRFHLTSLDFILVDLL